jgi:flagellar motor switch protein FliN/FliY
MTDTMTDDEPEQEDAEAHLADEGAEKAELELDEIEATDTTASDEEPVLGNKEAEEEIIRTATDLEAVYDVPVQVSAVLGKTRMEVSQLLKLGRGAVVELDRKVGEAIDIYVNNRLVARGEVVVVDERLGVTMTEIIKTDRS